MWKQIKSLVIIGVIIVILSITTLVFAALSNRDKNTEDNDVIESTVTEIASETATETTTVITTEITTESTLETTLETTTETIPETTTETTIETTIDSNNNYNPFFTEKVKVKAIYLSGSTVNNKDRLDHFIDLVNNTELNALVIDVKENGYVNYKSSIPIVKENNLYKNLYNPEEVIKKLHENNIYVIARIVCFKDNSLSRIFPERAITLSDGSFWLENGKTAWLNPFLEENWNYNIDIANEALAFGFDEIQYDYIRFPTSNIKGIVYQDVGLSKIEAINNFLEKSREVLGNAIISADVFGIICSSQSDEKYLGQDLETVGLDIDYISPMIYASHYNKERQEINGITIEKPDFYPYEVVYNALMAATKRLDLVDNYRADIRPYIQDFTASYLGKGYYQVYGEKQIREQIQAVYDAGYSQWIFWNGSNNYTENAFLTEDDL